MKILYVCSACSDKKYRELFKDQTYSNPQQAQKYHDLLINGLAKNNACVTVLSSLPVNRRISKKIIFHKQEEVLGKIKYIYLPFINIPIFRQLSLFLFCFFYITNRWKNYIDYPNICDVLNISSSCGLLLACKMHKMKSTGIVTDIPIFLSEEKKNIMNKLNNRITMIFDRYIFLTQDMNKIMNNKDKPYIVIEGQVDSNMKKTNNLLENKYKKKICIYAGGIQKKYGIKYLTEAFILANVFDSELHIYGSGDFENELVEVCKLYQNIKYFGVKSNNYIIKEELKATLLINPRPTNEEYTKYSFPSKNMEYMVSGTPTLTTKLPGMPTEYFEHLYLIEDETVEGISTELVQLLNKPKEELHQKGLDAKTFVLKYKNNIIQTKKIIEMLKIEKEDIK